MQLAFTVFSFRSFGIHTTSSNADQVAKLWSNTINFIIRGNEISKDDGYLKLNFQIKYQLLLYA